MKPIHEIVKDYVLKTHGRMPETEGEVNDYLDLINHSNEYSKALEMEKLIGRRMMKKLGFKNSNEIKRQGLKHN